MGLGRYTLPMKMLRTLLSASLAVLCFSAVAQWQWLDKDGRKVFSDRAPPSDILEKNILKRPGNRKPIEPVAEPASDASEPAAAAAASAPLAPASGAKAAGLDKELEAKKKQAAEAEAAKRKAAEAERTKAKIESCARAKQAKATFDSGVRIARINAAGEKEFMEDDARAAEVKRINGILAKDCN